MTDCDITASAPVLAAIDISKERHEVLIEAPDKKRRRRVSVLNNLDEFDRLISLLRSYQRPVRVAFEATGNYHRALAYQLGSAGFEIKLISSIALARTREALHNSWDKKRPCRTGLKPEPVFDASSRQKPPVINFSSSAHHFACYVRRIISCCHLTRFQRPASV